MGAAVVVLSGWMAVGQGRGWWRCQHVLAAHPLPFASVLQSEPSWQGQRVQLHSPSPPSCLPRASPHQGVRARHLAVQVPARQGHLDHLPHAGLGWAGNRAGQVGGGRGGGMQGWLAVGSKQRRRQHCWWQAGFLCFAHSRWPTHHPRHACPSSPLLSTVCGSVRRQEGGARPRPLPPGALR